MCGTLCCNCATQLSILILLRTDMMKEDRCLYLSAQYMFMTGTLNLNPLLSRGSLEHATTPSIFVAAFRPGGRSSVHTPAITHSSITYRSWRSWLLNTAGEGVQMGQSIDHTNEKLRGGAVTQLLRTPPCPCLMVGLQPVLC